MTDKEETPMKLAENKVKSPAEQSEQQAQDLQKKMNERYNDRYPNGVPPYVPSRSTQQIYDTLPKSGKDRVCGTQVPGGNTIGSCNLY